MSDDVGRPPGRLAGRRPDDRRTAARGRGGVARGLDIAEPALRDAESPAEPSLPEPIIMSDRLAADLDAVLDLDEDRGRDVDRRAMAVDAIGFAVCMFLAAVISAFAAVVIALVAVFMDCMAEDIVRADAVALVAAAVILVAAEVTLVAADDTPLAATAGVAVLRLDVPRRVVLGLRLMPVRLDVLRLVPARLAELRLVLVRRVADGREVARDAVDRDAVLRVDRDAVVRGVARIVLRLRDAVADDVPEPDVDFDRLAVPRDALRLTGLLRAELAELRRVAARVVD